MSVNEGVGKKIVEALKKQSEAELEVSKNLADVQNVAAPEIEEDYLIKEDVAEQEQTAQPQIISSVEPTEIEEPVEKMIEPLFAQENNVKETWNFEPQQSFLNEQTDTKAKQFDMPPNVAVLKKLITQLPSGVTKQTGAQIIKQTMEALGISMNTVLHEAQKVQDDMNESIKNCMVAIQEYKNNIRNLEKQGLDYQRQVNQLNDLISLFILSDKD